MKNIDKKQLKKIGISQRDLMKACKVSEVTVSRWKKIPEKYYDDIIEYVSYRAIKLCKFVEERI